MTNRRRGVFWVIDGELLAVPYEEKQEFIPKIIMVSPPEIGKDIRTSPFYGEFVEDAIEESKRFQEFYKIVAAEKGCIFFDATKYIYPSDIDSLHLEPEGHEILADELYHVIKNIV